MSNRICRSALVWSIPVVLLCLVWYAHVFLTMGGDPLGIPFDTGLWVVGSVLKLAAIVFTAPVLATLLGCMAGSIRRTATVSLLLIGTGWSLIVLASLTREEWAPVLTNDAIKYYSVFDEQSHLGVGSHWAKWKTDWQSGVVSLAECGLVLILAFLTAIVGYFAGHKRIISVVTVYIGVLVVLIAYNLVTNWHVSDYDEFHGDLFATAVLIDHLIFFVAIDPYTTLTSLVYCAFTVVSLLTIGIYKRQMNAPLIDGTIST